MVANQQRMLLKEEGVVWNQITFALYRLPSCWSVKKLQKHNVIGRDPTCSIVIEDETISSFHFQITNDHLEDLQSTNGTYCNDKRIRKQKLNALDHLWFGTKEAYYLPGYLVLGVLQEQKNVVFDKIPELPKIQAISQTVKTVQQASFFVTVTAAVNAHSQRALVSIDGLLFVDIDFRFGQCRRCMDQFTATKLFGGIANDQCGIYGIGLWCLWLVESKDDSSRKEKRKPSFD